MWSRINGKNILTLWGWDHFSSYGIEGASDPFNIIVASKLVAPSQTAREAKRSGKCDVSPGGLPSFGWSWSKSHRSLLGLKMMETETIWHIYWDILNIRSETQVIGNHCSALVFSVVELVTASKWRNVAPKYVILTPLLHEVSLV